MKLKRYVSNSYAKVHDESWRVIVGYDRTKSLLAMKTYLPSSRIRSALKDNLVTIDLTIPEVPGSRNDLIIVYVMSEQIIGMDCQYPICVDIMVC